MIDRNPSELPSTLLDKNVPKFETESTIKRRKNLFRPKCLEKKLHW